jgi:hypothetical protein
MITHRALVSDIHVSPGGRLDTATLRALGRR